MENIKNTSSFSFLWFKIIFTDERCWYKLIVIALALGITTVIILILKQWATPTIIAERLSHLKITALINLLKGKAP